MADAPSFWQASLARVTRYWWVVAIAVVAATAGTYALATPGRGEAVGIINVRPLLSLPNDRLDLIEDLQAAANQTSVLSGPASRAGLGVSELRNALNVERLGASNLVSVTYADEDGEAAAEGVIQDVVDSAASFLSGSADSPKLPEAMQSALKGATAAEGKAAKAVSAAIIANRGVSPDVGLKRLQARAGALTSSAEQKAVKAAVLKAERFDQLKANLTRARATITSLNERAVEQQVSDLNATLVIPVAFQDAASPGPVQSSDLRRSVAAGLAAGLLVACIIGFGGRSNRSTIGRGSAD